MSTSYVEVLEATKNGDVLRFKMRIDGDIEIWREKEDFSWLMHCIRNETNEQGVIYPPLPLIGSSDPREAEKKAKEQYGDGSHILTSESFSYECKQMERFLRMLLHHPTLSSTHALKDFLTQEEAASRVPIKQSRVLKWSNSVSEKLKSSYKDVSPFFEDERHKTASALLRYRSCHSSFKKMVNCQLRTSLAQRNVAAENAGDCGLSEDLRQQMRRLDAVFSKAMSNLAFINETSAQELCQTMGRFLELYEGFYDNLREALFKRTLLLIAFQDALKAVDKSKPDRKASVEEVRVAKEKEFEDFSHELKEEIVRFHRERMEAAHRAVAQIARAATKAAVDRHAVMASELNLIKNLPI